MTVLIGGRGLQIPNMEILEELGRGAQTQVLRGRRSGRDFAVKVGLALLADDAAAAVSFRREAAILATARHESLAEIFEVGEVAGRPYLVMELVEGRTLAQLLSERPLTEDALVRVGIDVAGGLAEAHRRGVVHLDVKPENIIVGANGRAKIIDFGLAGYAGVQSYDAVTGTLQYASPEQTGMLKRPVDRRADLYALGVVLFEAASGDLPFVSSDPAEVIRMHAVMPAPPLGELRPDLDPSLAAIVAKLLAKDPDDRYQSGDGLVADLRMVAAHPATLELDRHGRSNAGALLPFVGRATEIAILRSEWAASREGQVRQVTIAGPAGIGKSRLVAEMIGALTTHDGVVLSAACAPADPVPFAAIREAFNSYLQSLSLLAATDADEAVQRLIEAAGPFALSISSLSPALSSVLKCGSPVPGSKERDEQFAVTFALFVSEFARCAGGMVFCIDDAQWIDDASSKLLDQLADGEDQGPILIIRTLQTGLDDARVIAGPGQSVPLGPRGVAGPVMLNLGPLGDAEAAGLVVADLQGGVDGDFAARVAVRSGGNPLALVEYLRAVVDAGVIEPYWGEWRVDQAGLDSLALPEGVVELVLRRIDRLATDAKEVLVVAAAVGSTFDLGLVAGVCGRPPEAVAAAVAEAVAAALVEMQSSTTASFVHARIRDGLLSTVDESVHRRLHQSIAEIADVADVQGEALFALARHYQFGVAGASTARLIEVSRLASRAAQDVHASGEAYAFGSEAYVAAKRFGLDIDADFEQQMGRVCLLDGRSSEAREHYQQAVDLSDDRWARAAGRGELARIEVAEARPDRAIAHVHAALRDVGPPLSHNAVVWMITTFARSFAAVLIGRTRIGFGTAKGERRQHHATTTVLYEVGVKASYFRGDIKSTVTFGLAGLYPASRLGISPEYIRVHSVLCMLAGVIRRRRAVNRAIPRLTRLAQEAAIPSLMATVAYNNSVAVEFLGDMSRAAGFYRTALNDYGRWFAADERTVANLTFVFNLWRRGHAVEAWYWVQQQERRPAGAHDTRQSSVDTWKGVVAASLGNGAGLGDVEDLCDQAERMSDRVQQNEAYGSLVAILLEQGRVDAMFDRLVTLCEAQDGSVVTASLWERAYFGGKVAGRLLQWREADAGADAEERARLRSAAQTACRELRRMVRFGPHPFLRTQVVIADAEFADLDNKPERAMRLLAKAERLAIELDAPSLRFRVLCERARCFARLGLPDHADTEAKYALALSVQQQWASQARQVRQEFNVSGPAAVAGASHSSKMAAHTSAIGSLGSTHHSRRLEALLQVSVAAASVIDPRQLARIALDEALVILGAERAFLFLATDNGENVSFYAGRDAHATDLGEALGYSTTAVEQARAERLALVVTGSDEGALIGSASAVIHGLRSILVAPLLLEGRFIGVVYLDSRLAKGMFTQADVEILVAIATQVAVSLETARSAQLEMLVHAEREQRTLVEGLRDVMADMTSTFDPTEVLQRLLMGLARAIAYDNASITVLDADGTGRVLAEYPSPPAHTSDRIPGGETRVQNPDAVARLLKGEPLLDAGGANPPPVGGQACTPRSWLAVPLAINSATTTIITVLSTTSGAYGDTQLEILRTIAAYGAVAHQNARLFTNNRRLAVTDELSGLDNRRSFFAQAGSKLEAARQDRLPLSALMVDIDHFKKVNDTYGHATGDDVIQTVAARLRFVARVDDITGRYGGEEFALLIAAPADNAALVAERLRSAIAEQPIPTRTGPLTITVSIGITDLIPTDSTIEELLARADAALYEAKNSGRNRVIHC